MILPISSFTDPALDVYARKTEVQLLNRETPAEGLFIAESPKVIERALNAGYEPVSFLMETRHAETEGKALLERCPDLPFYIAEESLLSQLTGFHLTRGMLCAMRRPPLPSAEAVCREARRIAVLENIMNPTNLGAIFRSAAALNMDAVLLTPGCADPLYRRCIRVSMGTVFQVPWTYLGASAAEAPTVDLAALEALGFQTVSMALRKDTLDLRDERLLSIPRLAVILGTEGEGLSDATIDGSTYTVRIPMSHGVDSLNVAAASAVAFYQLGRRE